MMVPLLTLLSLLMTTAAPGQTVPAPRSDSPGILLSYDRPLGQVAVYRLSLAASGEEVSLGETLPVNWEAVVEIREEVVAKGADGALWLRLEARPVEIKDKAGTLAAGLPSRWPVLQVRTTSRGVILDVGPATGEPEEGMRARSLVALAAQPPSVVLPDHPVTVGEEWEYSSGEARQSGHLLEMSEAGGERSARIASTGSSPLALTEACEPLGLTTALEGQVREETETVLLLDRGLVNRQTGEMHLLTNCDVSLKLPEGDTVFGMESDIRVTFDLRLVEVDGQHLADS